jgi:hypothetical protein
MYVSLARCRPLGTGDAEHLVAALLEFVWNAPEFAAVAVLGQLARNRREVGRMSAAKARQERENARLAGHAAQLANGIDVKVEREEIGIGEEKMGTDREIEFPVAKGERR